MLHPVLRRFVVCVVMGQLLFTASCGDQSNRLKLYAVHGRVLCDEAPVAGARVIFHPDNTLPNMPNFPGGRTDADGHFQLTTIKTNDGAPAGTYKVLVIWPAKPGRGDRSGEGEAGDRLEGRYGTPEATPLSAEVKEGNKEPLTFVVK
jgi:hypothetical protein